jgi:hypothetical protein
MNDVLLQILCVLAALATSPSAPPRPTAAAPPAATAAKPAPGPAALHEGRKTYLPYSSGPYRMADSTGWRLDQRGAELYGDGVIGEDVGLRYGAGASGTGNSTILRLAAPHLYLHDLVLSGPTGVTGSGDAIRFDERSTIWGVVLDRVNALYAGRNCLRLAPQPNADGSPNFCVSFSVRSCSFFGAGGDGVLVENATDADWSRVTSQNCGGRGFVFRHIESSRFKLCAEHVTGGIYVQDAQGCVFDALHLEEFAGKGPTPAPGLVLDGCKGVRVGPSLFSSWGRPGAVSIRLINGCTHCVIEPSYHASVAVAVEVDSTCHDNTIYGQEGAPIRVDRKRNRVLD